MTRLRFTLAIPLALATAVAMVAPLATAGAQELSESHLQAARSALDATGATASFDQVLITVSAGLKGQLAGIIPDKLEQIDTVVDEETLKLVARRGALEAEAAKAYANAFTETELNELAAFYSSATGQKFLQNAPIVTRELQKAAQVWSAGIQRDLSAAVNERLKPS